MPENHRGTEDTEVVKDVTWDDALPAELNDLSGRIIRCCIAVHRELGPGWLELHYERALALEMTRQGLRFDRQKQVMLTYRGQSIGIAQLDFVVEDRIIVELKAVEQISQVHRAQCIAYLKATGLRLCLLINFNVAALREGVRRIAR